VPGLLSCIAGAVGLLSLLMLCIPICGCPIGGIFAITAIVLGGIALYQIKANPERYTGRGLAVAGLSMGIFVLLVYAAAIIVFIIAAARHK
jgi:Domain of unknown function (DUF4190)